MHELTTSPFRSALMKKVKRKDTFPELSVHRLLRDLGIRYRVNVSNLPGKPDIAHKGLGKVIFVHGCFWHYHEGCPRGTIPKNNREFWNDKLHGNRRRDQLKQAELSALGFDVLVVWECELKDERALKNRLLNFWDSETITITESS